jgi:hypothetical protein
MGLRLSRERRLSGKQFGRVTDRARPVAAAQVSENRSLASLP